MSFKLIIFDCDGVLVDSEQLGNHVFAEMLAIYGHKITGDEATTRFRGGKFAQCLEILESETGIVLPDSFESDFRQRASAVFKAELQAVDGALKLVESLRIPFCVASSGPRQKIEQNLKTANLYPHFAGKIFSAYEYNSWKPDPGLFLSAAEHFGIAPSDCVVIEDSLVGVSAGLAANMTVLGLTAAEDGSPVSAANQVFASMHEIHDYFVSQALAHE